MTRIVSAEREELEKSLLSGWLTGSSDVSPSSLAEYQWSRRDLRELFGAVAAMLADGVEPSSVPRTAVEETAARAGYNVSECLTFLSDVTPSLLMGRDCDRLKALERRDRTREALARADQSVASGDYAGAREALAALDSAEDGIVLKTSADVAGAAIESMSNPRRGADVGVQTLASELGQLPPGAVLTLGGYTGTGKSSLALLMAYRAQQTGGRVGLLSVEDPAETWGQRLLSLACGVPPDAIQRRTVTKDQADRLRTGIDSVAGVQISWCCGAGMDASLGVAIADQMARDGAKMIVIDYLQAFRTPMSSERYDSVSDLFKALKGVASRRGCALVVLSQLSRPERGGEYREPKITQLKESGDIENESEAILLLWQSGPNAQDPTLARLAKLKWGPRGAKFLLERSNGMITDMKRIYDKSPSPTDSSSFSDRSY